MTTALASTLIPFADTFGMHDGDVGAGWWLLMMLGMVIFWGAVIYLVVWLVRGGASQTTPRGENAGEILDRRLASGEISVEEYRQRKGVLTSTGMAPRPPPAAPATPA